MTDRKSSRTSQPANDVHGGPACYKSDQEKVDLEARNGLLQFDRVKELFLEFDGDFHLTPEIVCDLQRCVIQNIYKCAGSFRWDAIHISGTPHQPPNHADVRTHVGDMCEYANSQSNGVHVCAYLMWRLNWIHPFFGGNGRTSRAVGYLALCSIFNIDFPGSTTIPDIIEGDRKPYYKALDGADAAWKEGRLDISVMESLVESLLMIQLKSAGL